MSNSEEWDDKKFFGLIGDKEVEVLTTLKEPEPGGSDTNMCVLFTYPDAEPNNIYALRWKLGAVLDLGTTDLQLAKGSIRTMLMMEASDNES